MLLPPPFVTMTRLILPILAILATLHRLHGFVNFAPPTAAGVFGARKTFSTSSALLATKEEADNEEEIDDGDSYSPAPWENELHCIIYKRRLEKTWVDRMTRSKTRFLPYEKCR